MLLSKNVIIILFFSSVVMSCFSSTREQLLEKNMPVEKKDIVMIDSIRCKDCYRTIILNFHDGEKWKLLEDNYSFEYYYLTVYVDSTGSLVNDRNKKMFNSHFFINYLGKEEIDLFSNKLDDSPFLFLNTIDDWDTNNDAVFYLDTLFTSNRIISYVVHVFIGASKYPEPSCIYTYDPINNNDLILEDFINPSIDFNQYIQRTFEEKKKNVCLDYNEDSLDISDPCGVIDPMMYIHPYDYNKIKLDNDTFNLVSIEKEGIRISLNTVDYIKSFKRLPCFEEDSITETGPVYRTFTMLLPIDSIQPYLNIKSKYGLYFKRN